MNTTSSAVNDSPSDHVTPSFSGMVTSVKSLLYCASPSASPGIISPVAKSTLHSGSFTSCCVPRSRFFQPTQLLKLDGEPTRPDSGAAMTVSPRGRPLSVSCCSGASGTIWASSDGSCPPAANASEADNSRTKRTSIFLFISCLLFVLALTERGGDGSFSNQIHGLSRKRCERAPKIRLPPLIHLLAVICAIAGFTAHVTGCTMRGRGRYEHPYVGLGAPSTRRQAPGR